MLGCLGFWGASRFLGFSGLRAHKVLGRVLGLLGFGGGGLFRLLRFWAFRFFFFFGGGGGGFGSL